MSSDGLAYRFETAAQQALCLVMATPERHDLDRADGEVVTNLSGAVSAFLMAPGGRPVWIDADGALRADACAGSRVGFVRRMAAGRRALWLLSDAGLFHFDNETLQRMEMLDANDAADIAIGTDGVWLLLSDGLLRIGRKPARRPLPAAAAAIDRIAIHGDSLALLDRAANRLILQRPDKPDLALDLADPLGAGQPAFTARDIQSAPAGFLLSGDWDGAAGYLMLDPNGEPGAWGRFDVAPIAFAAQDDALYLLYQDGAVASLLRFPGAAVLGGQLWLTPALESDTLAGDWLQASIAATLPEGATLSLRWAASRDAALRLSADALLDDDSLLLGQRARILGALLDWSPITRTFAETAHNVLKSNPCCFSLTGADGSFLWLEVRLDRNNAASAPVLHSLVVSHDQPGLMQWLPAVYATPQGDLDGTLGRLVGLFQAVGGELDHAIGALAILFDPKAASPAWLPRLAGLLDLPFDETLPEAAQRAIIAAAPRLLAQRGARAAILTLLTATLGDRPYRVIDRTGEFAPVTLGGPTLGGSTLPALLAGPSAASPALNARLILGRTPLGCPGAPSVSRAPELFVEIPAPPAETRRYRMVIEAMLGRLVPAGVRLRTRWTALAATGADVLTVLDDGRPIILGDARPLGIAPLGGDDSLIGGAGSSIPVTLQ
ncbi:hypothetical protein AX777_01245 [Sphingobium yanoikuyae]|jgi:phage tail-like protein|uniref:Phage tail protein n=1 Tax=Sphingobium yanoikuyae TaxID=13690 RepID=A0A177K1R7_SPHYA|nr:phage tail protein [Sphingobium yanoikuyae]OAH46521.1 hypothetical protein AX777_01245 [Sphingobium yanoikuyae]